MQDALPALAGGGTRQPAQHAGLDGQHVVLIPGS
jgi:hypothetical protein